MPKFTAVAYYGGIPPNNSNIEKPQILDNFCAGIEKCGDIAIRNRGLEVILGDVALIQGFVHENGKKLPHLQLRENAYKLQKINNKNTLIVDSNLFLYKDISNRKKYLRYSFNGIFPTTGFYFDTTPDINRWQKIKLDLGIDLKDFRSNGDHILICLQRNGGWSMQNNDVLSWLEKTIKTIRLYSDRKIIVRPHPGDKKTKIQQTILSKNVFVSSNPLLLTDLQNAWATVVFNSSPSVASIIEGIPAFVTDPTPQNSQSFAVCNLNLKNIEHPELKNRQEWVEKLSMSHWNFQELASGEAWMFFRQFL